MTQSCTFYDAKWHDGDAPIMGPMAQAMWLGSMVFDGVRCFEGVIPDLAAHCGRSLRSARAIGMIPPVTADEIMDLVRDAVRRFPPGARLYIRPMFWPMSGGVVADPDSTKFALCVYEDPLPPETGFAAALSTYRRPRPESMVTGAKASCLYPALWQPIAKARQEGYDTIVSLDSWDNLAEFGTSNLFLVRDGVVFTPAPNETYLNGITRQRVIRLLSESGVRVVETILRLQDLAGADEAFSTGNHGKVQPMIRLSTNPFPIGPVFRQARELYMDFAHSLNSSALGKISTSDLL